MTPASPDLLPRVLIVSRRTVRKNKFVDFVGEYHLDLLVGYGAAPVIVPRVSGVYAMIDAFEPIHGVLLCEGEDIHPSLYASAGDEDDDGLLSAEQMEAVRRLHPSDAAMADHEKDSIELLLARRCLEKGIPFLGICRGSQVLNVASGGSLYHDLDLELGHGGHGGVVRHIDYGDYDAHRHPVRVLPGTPLRDWFGAMRDETIMVNSYHHQGVRRLAPRFAPMAFAPDGLVEAFYDPAEYSPGEGKFAVGLQFHPERMRKCVAAGAGEDEFDYPGCPIAYREFVRAAAAYQAKQMKLKLNPMPMPMPARALDAPVRAQAKPEKQKQRRVILRSFSLAKNLYYTFCGGGNGGVRTEEELDAGAGFLESESTAAALSAQQEKRLKQMGATVRNASGYMNRVKAQQSEEREGAARALMAKMSAAQLSSLAAFYRAMGSICAEVLDAKASSSLQPAA